MGLASPPKTLVFSASLSCYEPLAPQWIAVALLHREANRSKLVAKMYVKILKLPNLCVQMKKENTKKQVWGGWGKSSLYLYKYI